jgi:hypothetical protein
MESTYLGVYEAARIGNYELYELEFSSKYSKALQFYRSVHYYGPSHLHFTDKSVHYKTT